MARIYLGLAIFSFVLLTLNIVLGLRTGPYGETAQATFAARHTLEDLKRNKAPAEEIDTAVQKHAAAMAGAKELHGRVVTHMLLGIAASLVAVLVNSISVTYFVGTSRWCREVVEAYDLDRSLAIDSQKLKRRTFPWAVTGMLMVVLLVALGALSDPGANVSGHLFWRLWHFGAAVFGTMLIGYGYLIQMRNVAANYRIIEEILSEVGRIRAARQLDQKEPAPTTATA